jgi:hypothetical protein
MSVLRADLRLRDEPARAHPPAPSGHPRALPLLPPLVHAQQHRAPPYCPRAPPPGQSQDDPDQVWPDEGDAGPTVHGRHEPVSALTAAVAGDGRDGVRRRSGTARL